jgi:hypothetical protein
MIEMASVLIRAMSDEHARVLKARARQHRRSAQGEVAYLLETEGPGFPDDGSRLALEEFRAVAQRWQRRLAGRYFVDSADLTRADRDADHRLR